MALPFSASGGLLSSLDHVWPSSSIVKASNITSLFLLLHSHLPLLITVASFFKKIIFAAVQLIYYVVLVKCIAK